MISARLKAVISSRAAIRRSDYFLSIQVSYPNERDMKHAKANGVDPGGSIMIHGCRTRSSASRRTTRATGRMGALPCPCGHDRNLAPHEQQHADRHPALTGRREHILGSHRLTCRKSSTRRRPARQPRNAVASRRSTCCSIRGRAAFIRCSAVARWPSSIPAADNDNAKELFERYRDFELTVVRHSLGHPPAGPQRARRRLRRWPDDHRIKEHLFAVLRDVVYIAHEIDI